jgi:Tol biopolymer transport system component
VVGITAGPRLIAHVARTGLALAIAATVVAAYQATRPVVRSQLVWFDRSGKRLGALGAIGDYGNLELSPDGKQVGVAVLDPTVGTRDVWVYEVATGAKTQFTSGPADENWLIWSPDGRRAVFNSSRNGGLDLFEARSASHDPQTTLLVDRDAKWPVSWSPDGRFILYVTSSQATANDVWVLPLSGDRTPFPFARTDAAENWAAFSPNGRWVAYSSNQTGDAEVYVAPFPPSRSARPRRISSAGGYQARWRRDGKEIFFISSDRTLMAAGVEAEGSDIQVGAPQSLFSIRFPYGQYHAFDVAADGRRLLVNTSVISPGAPTAIAAR